MHPVPCPPHAMAVDRPYKYDECGWQTGLYGDLYQSPAQALRFSYYRVEREKRVTGDEPQGTMGKVQTAGEAHGSQCKKTNCIANK